MVPATPPWKTETQLESTDASVVIAHPFSQLEIALQGFSLNNKGRSKRDKMIKGSKPRQQTKPATRRHVKEIQQAL